MLTKQFIISASLLMLICFSGTACSTIKSANANEYGWKTGRVERIALGHDLKDIAIRECVAPFPLEVINESHFAVVHYRQGRWSKYRTVAIPENSTIRAQDEVRINIADCSAPVLPIDNDSTND